MTQTGSAGDALIGRTSHDGCLTLTLNRPASFNALSHAMLDALDHELSLAAADDNLRVVVLAAHGKAFSAGHDLKEMRGLSTLADYRALFGRCSAVMQAIRALPVPVIARVQGIATAAGCQLVASCDLAIAASSARFAVSGINVGLFCSTPAVALSRNIATKRAFDMLVTGHFIDAATACEWGLVNAVAEPEELDEAIARKVADIMAKSPAAIRHGKALFYRQQALGLQDAYDLACDVMAANIMEEDARDGIDAFIEKRPARQKA